MKSMTGFAKLEVEGPEGRLYGEARSLNSRYLEINLKLSRTDSLYEQKLRELAKQSVKRGKVDIAIKWERSVGQPAPYKVNESVVKQYIEMARALKEEYGVRGDLTLETLFNQRDILTYEETNAIPEETLLPAFESLLEKLNEEKSKEGMIIRNDLFKRLAAIAVPLKEIEERWPANIEAHGEKLRERVVEATKATPVDEGRILQELAIYMERLDIAEEMVRLRGHMGNFKDTVDSDESIGRKLDFIIQEMVREANTIGSKSSDLYINERVIQIKVEIEKMREQAQNVE
jgi:uncharacterized protein (TIGR00255 family)